MSEVIDLIHRLSYEVVGNENLKSVIDNLQKQANSIDTLKSKLAELQNYYMSSNKQEQADAINKVTKAIQDQTEALTKSFYGNKKLQEALNDEIGTLKQLAQYIAQAKKEQASLTDPAQIKRYQLEIEKAQREMKALVDTSTDGYIKQAGAIEILENRIKLLNNALRQAPKDNIAQINTQIKYANDELNKLKSNGASNIVPPANTSILSGIFGGGGSIGRQLLQGTLYSFGIGSGFGLITRLTSALFDYAQQLVDTDEKENKLKKDIDNTNLSIVNQTNSFIELSEKIANAFNAGDEARQDLINSTKALGVINGQVYNQQVRDLNAVNDAYKNNTSQIRQQIDLYSEVLKVINSARQVGINNIVQIDKNTGQLQQVPGGFDTVISPQALGVLGNNIEEIKKASGISNTDKRAQAFRDLADKFLLQQNELNTKLTKADEDNKNANVEFQSKINEQIYQLNKQLYEQSLAAEQQYQQSRIAFQTDSVEKIKAAIESERRFRLNELERQKQDEIKINGALPQSTLAAYGRRAGDINTELNQRRSQLIEQFQETQARAQDQLDSILQTTRNSNTQGAMALGLLTGNLSLADYLNAANEQNNTLSANNAQNEQQAREQARIAGKSLLEIEEEFQKSREQLVENENRNIVNAYLQYYQDLIGVIKNESQSVLNVIQENTDSQISALSNRLGHGLSGDNYQRLKEIATLKGGIHQDQAQLGRNDQEQQKTQDTLNTPGLSAADISALQDKLTQLQDEADKLNIDINEKTAQTGDIQKQQLLEYIDLLQQAAETAVQSYDIINEARQKDLDREIAVRTQRVDMAEKLAERGNTTALAQEQKALDQANQQKRNAALQEQEINAALTVSNALLAVAKAAVEGGGFASIATIAAVIAALGVGFAEAESLSASQKQQFYKGGYTGDGGKYDEAGTVHRGEFVFTKEKTEQYRPLFEYIHAGNEVMPKMINYNHSGFGSQRDIDALSEKLDGVTDAINSIRVSQSVDQNGIRQLFQQSQKAHAAKWK